MNSICLGLSHSQNISVYLVRRQVNYITHVLVKVPQLYLSLHLFDFVPTYISAFVTNKMIQISLGKIK